MSTIELSPSLGVKQTRRVVGVLDAIGCAESNTYNGYITNEQDAALFCQANGGNSQFFNTWINIMQGPLPVSFAELGMDVAPTTLSGMKRASDVLVSISNGINDTAGFDKANCIMNTNPCVINTFYKPAIKSGLASWFYIVTIGGYMNLNTISSITEFVPATPADYHPHPYVAQQAWGTLGTIGSGADLELANLNVVQDIPYRITNLSLQLPTSWSY